MPNHLAAETSPYLLQHANNPVDWYPWGEEALTLARRQDKPILLSIGYSTCHWCHVMAHESFEDESIAALLNEHFVNIKVDREERPDLDQIYQSAHQLLTRRPGGWPLNMFLTPDQVPYFGGTYFPKDGRGQMMGFRELIPLLARHYGEKGRQMGELGVSLKEAMETGSGTAPTVGLTARPLETAYGSLTTSFDEVHGGFGAAPKFPRPMELDFLLRRWSAKEDGRALSMATRTLSAMAEGGLYDQLGGGFFRYSVDERWAIPHFEKMLYDNGLLLTVYADAWVATGNPLFRQVVEETCAWLLREMHSPEGGFYSALDADSEHEEGKFYVWGLEEARSSMTPQEWRVAETSLGFDRAPNFEGVAWHPAQARSVEETAQAVGISLEQAAQRLQSAKGKMFAARESRVRPGRDEKVLTAWNALVIKGLARAGRLLGRKEWITTASQAAEFLRDRLWRDGRLLAVYKDGKARHPAYLDDYAYFLDALLELLQTEFRETWLALAQALAEALLKRFEDRDGSGFYFTAHDHETLLARLKPAFDNAMPAGNGVAIQVLQRLGHLLAENRYLGAAERGLKGFAGEIERHPAGCLALLSALDEWLDAPRVVALRGPAPEVEAWAGELGRVYLPRCLVLPLPNGTKGIPAGLAHSEPCVVNAWVCESVSCLPVIEDVSLLRQVCKGGKVV